MSERCYYCTRKLNYHCDGCGKPICSTHVTSSHGWIVTKDYCPECSE